jgi:hypothetical protein
MFWALRRVFNNLRDQSEAKKVKENIELIDGMVSKVT